MAKVPESESKIYARCDCNRLHRRILATIGKVLRPVIVFFARVSREKNYSLHITGQENIPKDKPCVFVANHQLRLDPITYMEAIMRTTKRVVSPLAALDGNSTELDYLGLELFGAVSTLRGEDEISRTVQKNAIIQLVDKLKRGNNQLVFSEGTFCPIYNDMLMLHKGSAIEVPKAADAYLIPVVAVISSDGGGNVTGYYIEFNKPFQYNEYPDSEVAADALRDLMVGRKQALNTEYNPDMTQKEWSLTRKVYYTKYPNDHEYYDNAKYTVNYKIDPEVTEAMFRNN